MAASPDQFIDLRDCVAKYRAWLEEQLAACQSGRFQIFSVESGQKIDTTPAHIARIKQLISEHDRILDSLGAKNA